MNVSTFKKLQAEIASFIIINTRTISYMGLPDFEPATLFFRVRERAIREMMSRLIDILPYEVCKSARPLKSTVLEKASEFICSLKDDIQLLEKKLSISQSPSQEQGTQGHLKDIRCRFIRDYVLSSFFITVVVTSTSFG